VLRCGLLYAASTPGHLSPQRASPAVSIWETNPATGFAAPLDVDAPHAKWLPTEAVVDLQRLGAEKAFAEAPLSPYHGPVPPLAQIAAQRVHFFAPPDKTGLQHTRATVWIGLSVRRSVVSIATLPAPSSLVPRGKSGPR